MSAAMIVKTIGTWLIGAAETMGLRREISRWNIEIEKREKELLNLPQIECPPVHRFAPGAYLRELTMPRGSFVIGHEHTTEHFNIVTKGRCRVLMEGRVEEIKAPAVFVSKPGVRKVLYVIEETTWLTLHPTDETDLDKLEKKLIRKSKAWLQAHEVARLKEEDVT